MADSITKPRYPSWRSAARQIWKDGGVRVSLPFFPYLISTFLRITDICFQLESH